MPSIGEVIVLLMVPLKIVITLLPKTKVVKEKTPKMEQELTTLKATLADAFNQFAGPLKSELSHSLHTYEKDHLPHKQLSELAAEAVDLLHSIEQLLTPPPLIVADHFLGKKTP